MSALQYYRTTTNSKILGTFYVVENSFGIAYKGVAHSPELGVAVAVGYNGAAYTHDGVSWTQSAPPAYNWNSVAWSPSLGIFCAVASSGTGRVMTSSDGINWTQRNATIVGNWREIVWSPSLGIFCACRYGSSTTNHFMTSPDGINWVPQAVGSVFSANTVAWSDPLQIFVSAASGGTVRTVMSVNGVDWVNATTPESGGQIIKIYAHPIKPLLVMCRQAGGIGVRHSISNDGSLWEFFYLDGGTRPAWLYEPELDLMVTGRLGQPDARLRTSRNGRTNREAKATQVLANPRNGIYAFGKSIFVGDEGIVANNI